MKKNVKTENRTDVPESFVTKGKQRLKQHENTVYLENGDEFQIELFNPTQNKVLSQIELNGTNLVSGIVLRPGERVFLDRFLDSPEKFKFDTYFVDGDNNDVVNAISKNGKVSVKFYNEKLFHIPNYSWNTTGTWYNTPNTLRFFNDYYIPSTTTNLTSGVLNGSSTVTSSTNSAYFTNTSFNSDSTLSEPKMKSKKSLETGRIEKGSKSDQKFTYDQTSFETYHSWISEWTIKPKSIKPIMKEDLVMYCTECGSKRKKDNHNFCPHCGTKY